MRHHFLRLHIEKGKHMTVGCWHLCGHDGPWMKQWVSFNVFLVLDHLRSWQSIYWDHYQKLCRVANKRFLWLTVIQNTAFPPGYSSQGFLKLHSSTMGYFCMTSQTTYWPIAVQNLSKKFHDSMFNFGGEAAAGHGLSSADRQPIWANYLHISCQIVPVRFQTLEWVGYKRTTAELCFQFADS